METVNELGRREWKKQARYHQQARVENAFFRYKQRIGGRLRSRRLNGQRSEVRIAINILNRMLELGFTAIGASSKLSESRRGAVRSEGTCNNASELMSRASSVATRNCPLLAPCRVPSTRRKLEGDPALEAQTEP